MIRQAIANYINAKAERLRHLHEWRVVSQANVTGEFGGKWQERVYLCRCGKCKRIKSIL